MSNPRKRKASGSEWYNKHKKDVLKATAKSLGDVLQQESMLNASEKSKLKDELKKEVQWHLDNEKFNNTQLLIFLQTIEYDVPTYWNQFKTLTLPGNQTKIDDFYDENGSGQSKAKTNGSGESKAKTKGSGQSKAKKNGKVPKKVTFADENKSKEKAKGSGRKKAKGNGVLKKSKPNGKRKKKIRKSVPDLSLSDCDV